MAKPAAVNTTVVANKIASMYGITKTEAVRLINDVFEAIFEYNRLGYSVKIKNYFVFVPSRRYFKDKCHKTIKVRVSRVLKERLKGEDVD